MADSLKILVVGLGNPGKTYTSNRHNTGFRVINELAELLDLKFSQEEYMLSQIAKNNEYILSKPETYINLSGQAVRKIVEYYQLENRQVWVVQDDTEFPLGEVRIKLGGGSGGHNGIKSIDEVIGAEYWRIRIGVGRPEDPRYDLADYVLANFSAEETEIINSVIDQTASYLLKSLKERTIEATTFSISNGKETTNYTN